ncbi:hypothetical protein HKCCE4037_02760 [Rhodobacterales bacterium HKCCE4037]|nr:hypothetical protein [Rhodobacterales bacterium HKCCE4037]
MYAGIAAGLLVFTGVWHATEWMMDGRRRDTWLLVPFGAIYLLLGYLLVMGIGGMILQVAALAAVALGGSIAFLKRERLDIRRWVVWVFVAIDVLIALALVLALLR